MSLDSRALLPDTAPSVRDHDRAVSLFDAMPTVIVAITSESSVYTPESAARLLRVTRALQEIPGIQSSSVRSLATIQVAEVTGTLRMRPLLPAEAATDARLAARVRADVERLGLADGILAAADDLGWTVVAALAPGADGRSVLAALRHLSARESSAAAHISLGGTGLAQIALGEAAAADLLRTLPAALLLLALTLTVRLGIASAAIALTEVGLSIVITAGIAGAIGLPLFITSLVLPVVLLAVGVSDDVHATERLAAASSGADEESFVLVARPLLLTAATTIVSMASLTLATLRPLRMFGLLAALGLTCSALLTLTLVPALHALTGQFRRRVVRPAISRPRSPWPRHAVSSGVAVGAIVVLLTGSRVRVNDSWVWNLPAKHDVAAGARVLDNRFAGATTLEFVVDAGGPERWLLASWVTRLEELADRVAQDTAVGAVATMAGDVLRARALLAGTAVDDVRRTDRTRRGADVLDLGDAFVLLASQPDGDLGQRLDAAAGRTRMTLFVRRADHATLRRLVAAVRETSATLGLSVEPFGEGWLSSVAVEQLVQDQMRSIATALALDWTLLAILFASFTLASAAMVPVLIAVAAVVSVLGALNVPAGIANTMFVAIAIGIGTDFAVQTIYACRHAVSSGSNDPWSEGAAAVRAPILASAAGLAAGFGALLLAGAPTTRQLAAALMIVVVSAAVGALAIVPRLLNCDGQRGVTVEQSGRSFSDAAHVRSSRRPPYS